MGQAPSFVCVNRKRLIEGDSHNWDHSRSCIEVVLLKADFYLMPLLALICGVVIQTY